MTGGSAGRWLENSIDKTNKEIAATFDDALTGNCDGDITFNTYWDAPSNKIISIKSEKVSKRAWCFFWFCHNLHYGYISTASNNCRFLGISGACTSSGYCPLPEGIDTNTLYFWQPDTYGFTSYDYIVGECLSNDKADGTSTICTTLYGTSKPVCDTATNMCSVYGTCEKECAKAALPKPSRHKN